jgi:hypothetical protein
MSRMAVGKSKEPARRRRYENRAQTIGTIRESLSWTWTARGKVKSLGSEDPSYIKAVRIGARTEGE